eukprot:CAMPEP_0180176242 /NCGR_PEP_ID=MMETSP0986-20121125/37176_1 /TAXON_ID=697907 /ORGANISM="non described non described, Strain CCMP2293" /LENGTH=86 /DNA_ID=CAMNT_0022128827 /DNA_START=9 /DNA_END=265 /DNA_ORIENTATION=-
MCRDWAQTGVCQFQGQCSFAHGRHELRNPSDPACQGAISNLDLTTIANQTLQGRVARVMASDNYPAEAHFCIAESSPGLADVFISR